MDRWREKKREKGQKRAGQIERERRGETERVIENKKTRTSEEERERARGRKIEREEEEEERDTERERSG